MSKKDGLVRAMTDDGGFRVIAACMTQTVREAVAAQKLTSDLAAHLGELLIGSVLVRETMAPSFRVQGLLRGKNGHGLLVADSHPDGTTRGLVQRGNGAPVTIGGGSVLQMMRTMPNGELHTGTVELPESGGIGAGLMGYMLESEQVMSAVAVGCLMEGDEIKAAGGYVVQLLPELGEDMLALMTARLEDFPSMQTFLADPELTPDDLLGELLYRMPFTRLEERPVSFGCQCSQVRLLGSLSKLSRADLESLLENDDDLQITCDYCGKDYAIPPEQLRGLLSES